MRYHSLILAVLLAFALTFQGVAQNVPSPQKSTDITGNELIKLLHSNGYRQALSYIGEIYSRHFNNGVTPGLSTLMTLARIVDDYMFTLGRKWDGPAEALVIEALKDMPPRIDAQRQFWANAYKAAEAYLSQPSSSNAKKFSLALPDKEIQVLDDDGQRRLHDLVFDFVSREGGAPLPNPRKNFSTIERGMDKGDPHAVEIMFRLINISDGMATETICFVLGELIPKHPRLFLQKLLVHEATVSEHLLSTIVCMVTELGEIPEARGDQVKYRQIYNERITRRIKALESVYDPDLREIRDRCLSILKKEREQH